MNAPERPGGIEDVVARYLRRLPLPDAERAARLRELKPGRARDLRDALVGMHQSLAGSGATSHEGSAFASVRARLQLLLGSTALRDPVHDDVRHDVRLATMPPLRRASMVPQPWSANPLVRLGRWLAERTVGRRGLLASRSEPRRSPDAPDPRGAWHRTGLLRRSVLLALILSQSAVATYFMIAVLPYHGRHGLEIAVLAIYAILFGWVSAGFWTAMMGFWVLLTGGDRWAISRSAAADAAIDPQARTAILLPICNEDVSRVFAGLRAAFESVQRTGLPDLFDFYVLSDSSDPDLRVQELAAWLRLCRDVSGFGRIFYRRRKLRIKRKSGNIADFCRRWGSNYRYIVIFDADSVMSGACLTQLVRLMEANPNAGIIQTAPRAAGRDTLYGRLQQFATRIYGPLFTAGLHFWQLGESHYWGHNAIVRVAPFIQHCALGRLPGRGPFAGEILSHDFVEAALMRRAGWSVWIAYDLPGSFEEMPATLLEELRRDRRWCQGNLQNFRLFAAAGLHPAHRAVFMTGVMAYLSAPLWFISLALSTTILAVQVLAPPEYFTQPYQLFPVWPEWHPRWAVALFGATAALLFLPKLLALIVALRSARRFGGAGRLALGVTIESVFSALLAPIRMLFHTQFVLSSILGVALNWRSPARSDNQTSWREAIRHHGPGTLLGALWAAGIGWLNPHYLWWLAPVVGALIVAIPLSVWSSRVSLGRWCRRVGLFLVPEEAHPPLELRALKRHRTRQTLLPGFAEAVVDPLVNAMVCASEAPHPRIPPAVRDQRLRRAHTALSRGPGQLDAAARNAVLNDPICLSQMHFQVWSASELATFWRPFMS